MKLENLLPKTKSKVKCKHFQYCKVKYFGNIDCLNKNSIETCQTYKYYQRYGEDYNKLGVGSKI